MATDYIPNAGGDYQREHEASEPSVWWDCQNLGAEQAVLGAALMEPKAAAQVMARCRPGHFYRVPHRQVFYAMRAVHRAKLPIDLITTWEKLRTLGDETEVTTEYLTSLLGQVPTCAHVNAYIAILDECRQRWLEKARSMAVVNAPDSVREFEEELRRIAAGAGRGGGARPMGEFEDLDAGVEAHIRQSGRFDHGQPHFDLEDMDGHSGGLPCPGLVVVMGESSSGKTQLALQALYHWGIKHLQACLYCSAEMDVVRQVSRRMAYLHRDSRALTEEDFRAAMYEVAGNTQVRYYDRAGMTIGDIEAEAKRVAGETDLRLVVVDYLQLIRSDTGLEERQRLEDASQRLKHLSKDIGATVLSISQVTWDKDKVDANTFGARGIGFDADMEIEVRRSGATVYDQRAASDVTLRIRKHRDGAVGSFDCTFDGIRFRQAETEQPGWEVNRDARDF